MKHLIDIAKEFGYEPFRSTSKGLVPDTGNPMEFSSMVEGGIATIWMKEGFPNIVWGLSEYGKPPTLISPKPLVLIDGCWRLDDDAINHCLSKEAHEELFKNIIDKTEKMFYYEKIHSTK